MIAFFQRLRHMRIKKLELRDTRDPKEWLARNPLASPSPRSEIYVQFMTPLIGRDKARNWDTVCRWVQLTAESLLRQTDPTWKWVICGQDRPDTLPDDPRINFLLMSTPSGGAINDNNRKNGWRLGIWHISRREIVICSC